MKVKRFFAFFLSSAMIMAVFAGIPSVHAEDADINAWYSAEKDGGAVQYVEKGSEAYVNYEYKGDETAYNVHVEVSTAGNIILSRQYVNVGRNSVAVPFEEEGIYVLSVTVTDGENITASTTKTVECAVGLPVIDTHPADVASDAGQPVTFTVSSSTPGASYQWYTANTLMSEGHPVSGASTDQLTISAENVIDSLNGTYYYCQVMANGHTINSNYALLTINGVTSTPTPEPTGTPGATKIPGGSKGTPAPTKAPGTNRPAGTVSPGGTDSLGRADTPNGTDAPPSAQPDSPAQEKKLETKCRAKAVYSITRNKIKVSWNACGTSYKVYRSTKKKSGYTSKGTVKGTSYTDTKIQPGKTYYYKIQPIKAGTKAGASGTASVTANMKPAAKKYSVKKKRKSIKVTWKYDRADYVEVYVNTGNGWSRLGKVPGKKTRCSIGVPDGYSRVKVRIRAYNTVKKKKYYSRYSKAKTIKI